MPTAVEDMYGELDKVVARTGSLPGGGTSQIAMYADQAYANGVAYCIGLIEGRSKNDILAESRERVIASRAPKKRAIKRTPQKKTLKRRTLKR